MAYGFFLEEVSTYDITIPGGRPEEKASALLNTANANIYIKFYKEGFKFPGNFNPVIKGRQHFYVHFYYSDYPNIIDLLRNEKPIFFFFNENTKYANISTRKEPIGEGE